METTTLQSVIDQMKDSPEDALAIVMKATELMQAESDQAKLQAREMSEVTMGPEGFEVKNLGGLYRLGQVYANSSLIPDRYRGKPYDCAIVIQLAQRWRVNPFMAFLHVYIVHGTPAVDAQLATSLLHASGKIKGTVQYQFSGTPGTPDYGCSAYVEDAHTGETVHGPRVDWKVVKAEGWDRPRGVSKQASKWTTIPDLMFHYRSAAWLIRTRYPEVVMGMMTVEEAEEIGPSLEDAGLTVPAPEAAASELGGVTERLQQQAPAPGLSVPSKPLAQPPLNHPAPGAAPLAAAAAPLEPAPADPPELVTREAVADAEDRISRVQLIREVRAILDEFSARADLPDATKQAINRLADERIGQIQAENRRKRQEREAAQAAEKAGQTAPAPNEGQQTPPAQQATSEPAGPSPAAAKSEQTRNLAITRIEAAETAKGCQVIRDTALETGLLDDDLAEVDAAVAARVAELTQAPPQQAAPAAAAPGPVAPATQPQPTAQAPAPAGQSDLEVAAQGMLKQAQEATSDRSINMVRTTASQMVSEGTLIPSHYTQILSACDIRAGQLHDEANG